MDAVTLGTVVIDHCAHCSGIWFDEGELQAGLAQGGKKKLKSLSTAARAITGHDLKPANCPRCSQDIALVRIPSPGNNSPHIDVCSECGGVWYDGGEVAELLSDGLGVRIRKFLKGFVGN